MRISEIRNKLANVECPEGEDLGVNILNRFCPLDRHARNREWIDCLCRDFSILLRPDINDYNEYNDNKYYAHCGLIHFIEGCHDELMFNRALIPNTDL